ncbi:MAG: hypothetical protein A2Z11_03275 [Candidatus Woykebacteria bacterium RBG_16_43_9]|uniref:Homing endonuclease LAGLIDADG domain-containing protein n=1 Tax=Candidatus Woykebacteria bacterium RBG_16_43_9 TaxID=1802596 RepID=A0A1G1WCI2_9BACT|nr:MAG: hypothetical protein A2Z11_03275 [Candidatus Woykebacteria bacterium RBG_16_43_9]
MVSEKAASADNQQANIADEYLAGFVDGEGCFYVGFSRRKDLPLGWQVITEFHLSQNPGGKNLLEFFQKRLGCGYLKLNHPKSSKDKSWVLMIKDRRDLKEKLIPFFDKHGLHSQKQHDLEIFKKVIEIVESKDHLKKCGLTKIVSLVFDTSRITKKRYSKEAILSAL